MTNQEELKNFLNDNFEEKYDSTKETFKIYTNNQEKEINVNESCNNEKILFATSVGLTLENVKENIQYEYCLTNYNNSKSYMDVVVFNSNSFEEKPKVEILAENKMYDKAKFNQSHETHCIQLQNYLKELDSQDYIEKDGELWTTLIYYKPEVYFSNTANFANYLNQSYSIKQISEIDKIINETGFFIITWKIKQNEIKDPNFRLTQKNVTSFTIPFIAKFTDAYFTFSDERETIFSSRIRASISQLFKLPFHNNEGDSQINNTRELINIDNKDMVNTRKEIFYTFLRMYFNYKNAKNDETRSESLILDPDPRNLQFKLTKTIIKKEKTKGKLCNLIISSCNCSLTDGQHSSMNYYKIFKDIEMFIISNKKDFSGSDYDIIIQKFRRDFCIKSQFDLVDFKQNFLDKLTVDINIRGIENIDNAKLNTTIKNTRNEVSKKDLLEKEESYILNLICNNFNSSNKNVNKRIIQFNKSHHSNQLLIKNKQITIPLYYLYYISYYKKFIKFNNKEPKDNIIEEWERNFEQKFKIKDLIKNENLIQCFTSVYKNPESNKDAIKEFKKEVYEENINVKPVLLAKKIDEEIKKIKENIIDSESWTNIKTALEQNTEMNEGFKNRFKDNIEDLIDYISDNDLKNIDKKISKIEELIVSGSSVKIDVLTPYVEFISGLLPHYKNNKDKKLFDFDEQSYAKFIISFFIYNKLAIKKENLDKYLHIIDKNLEYSIKNDKLEFRDASKTSELRSGVKHLQGKTKIELLKIIYQIDVNIDDDNIKTDDSNNDYIDNDNVKKKKMML